MSDRRIYLHADLHEVLEGFDVTRTAEDFEPYQDWMYELLLEKKRVYIGAFMGSGKTAVCLRAARKLLDDGKIRRVLIVAPLAVAENTWPDEILVWDFARAFTYSVIVGTPEEREEARKKDVEVHIVNRENLVWLLKREGKRPPYDLLIYDEATRLREGSPFTRTEIVGADGKKKKKRSAFGWLARRRHFFDRVWLLSGTPAPNGLLDLWGPIFIIDGGERLFNSKSKYQNRWFEKNPWTRRVTPHPHSEEEIMGRIQDVFFCLREEDYIELPDLVVKDRYVTLPPKVMRMYREFEKTLVFDLHDIEAVNSGVLCNKLLQFANGSVYNEDGEDRFVHDCKIHELESIVEEAAGRSVMIAYSFQFDLKAIKKKYPKARIFGEGKNDLRDWQRGRIDKLLLHPASAGHGLNFQAGGNIVAWYGLNWSLELYQQLMKRLHRRGQQEDHVWAYRILAKNTNDERVAENLQLKDATQDRITDAVRVRLEELRDELL